MLPDSDFLETGSKKIGKIKQKKRLKITSSGLPSDLSNHSRSLRLRTVSVERGERVRLIRILLRKNLIEFASSLEINAGLIGRVERADTCLSINMALWLVKRLIKLGVLVTVSWLLFGKGDGPQLISKEEFSIMKFLDSKTNSEQDGEKQKALCGHLMEELFMEIHENAVISYVKDNKMSPIFTKGEVVCGIELAESEYEKALSMPCIIEVQPDQKIIRYVNFVDGFYIFSAFDKGENPIITTKKPKKIAPISFRYSFAHKTLFPESLLVPDEDAEVLEVDSYSDE